MTIPDLTDCENQRYMAGAAGALAAMIPNVDTALPLPRPVHWAAAGAATDVYCKKQFTIDTQLAFCAFGGLLGGYLGKYLVRLVTRPNVPLGLPVTFAPGSFVPLPVA